jgi:hypothetical protein
MDWSVWSLSVSEVLAQQVTMPVWVFLWFLMISNALLASLFIIRECRRIKASVSPPH